MELLTGILLTRRSTLAAQVATAGTAATNLTAVAPETSSVYGTAVPARAQAIAVRDGRAVTVAWTIKDRQGQVLDLAGLANPVVTLRFRETLSPVDTAAVEVSGSLVDPTAGTVQAAVDLQRLCGPGIYIAEFAVRDGADGPVLAQSPFTLYVEPSLFGGVAYAGPPTIMEIRLQLRDSSPAESRLLDTVCFDDAEIALAVQRPVQYFNEINPPLSRQYTTRDFPSRYHWVEGAIATLFRMVAEFYRRNHLSYQAGGIAVDDLAKAPDYEAAAQAHWETFTQWVRTTKIGMNMDAAWGGVGSQYDHSRAVWGSF